MSQSGLLDLDTEARLKWAQGVMWAVVLAFRANPFMSRSGLLDLAFLARYRKT
jgi:hypothetical protein